MSMSGSRRVCVESRARSSSSAAIRAAVSAQRSPDKLERLLPRRDRAGRPLLGDELEQAADLRARIDPELVAPQQRLGGVVSASLADGVRAVAGAEVCERLERPGLGRPAEAVE